MRGRSAARALVGLAFVGVAGAVAASACGARVNVSPSLPLGVYRVVHRPVVRGATVLLCLPASVARVARQRGYLWRGPCTGGVAPLGKIVAAVGGDTVEATASGVRINGVLLAGSRPLAVDTRGRRLVAVAGRWVLTSGQIWIYGGGDRRSFDSRYFGPVGAADVVTVMEPVLVWPGRTGAEW
ncbi:MAG TPA: conjugative transfer signal peptidase TraF [Gemmatimonadaceae bacterium]|jgi:conjugative transfer signal peptidase TraF|nr:conjugative transfer signal peptidase TraF [Gemmatimonadaceae bacterium]